MMTSFGKNFGKSAFVDYEYATGWLAPGVAGGSTTMG